MLRITNLDNLNKLIYYLYNNNDEIYLNRKFNKAMEIINR